MIGKLILKMSEILHVGRRSAVLAGVAAWMALTAAAFERIAFVDAFDFYNPDFDFQTVEGTDEVLDHVMLLRPTSCFWRTTTGGAYRYPSPSETGPLSRTPLDVRRPPIAIGTTLPWVNWGDVPTNLLMVAKDSQKRRGVGFGLHFPLEEQHADSPWMIGAWSLDHPQCWVGANVKGRAAWMGACRFTDPEAFAHKLRVVDEALFDGVDTFMLDLMRTGGWTVSCEGVPHEQVVRTMSAYIRAVARKVHAKGARFLLTLPRINNVGGRDDYTLTYFGIDWQTFAADGTVDGIVLHGAFPTKDPKRIWSHTKEIYESVVRQKGRAKVFLPVAMYGFEFGVNEYAKAAGCSRVEATRRLVDLAKEAGADGITFECVDYRNYPKDVVAELNRDLPGDRVLTEGRMPVYSPDGHRLAYAREQGSRMRVGVYDLETGRTVWTPETSGDAAHPAWHPTNGSLVYAHGDEKLTAAAAVAAKVRTGYNLRAVVPGGASAPTVLTSGRFYDYTPAYSPDGQQVYFVSTRALPSQAELWKRGILSGSGICRLTVADGRIKTLAKVERPVNRANPTVSPDGRLLAWAELAGLGAWQVKVARLDALEKSAVVGSLRLNAYCPRWSADGRYLAFTGFLPGDPGWGVYACEVATGTVKRLFDGEQPCFDATGAKIAYVKRGIIHEHVLRAGELPQAETADAVTRPPSKALLQINDPEWKKAYPLDARFAFGTEKTVYVRARLKVPAKILDGVWMVANCRYKETALGLQICGAKDAVGFATRIVPNRYAPIWHPRKVVPNEELEVVGIRHEGRMYVSVNGSKPTVAPIIGTMESLDTPIQVDVDSYVRDGLMRSPCTCLEIGSGWPVDVPGPLTLSELLKETL